MGSALRALALLAPIALLAFAARAQDPPADPAAATWYAQALTRGEAGLNVVNFWSKGAALRSETVVAGHKVVTIVHGDWYYAYDGLTGEGLAVRREPAVVARDGHKRRPFGNEYDILVSQGAEQIRQEQLLGRPTGVYRVTDRHGRRELWVTLDDTRIPLRLEIFDRSSGERRTTDYVNWQSDLAIPDAFFEPEATARLERLDYREYLRRSAVEGPIGPVPLLYTSLLYDRQEE